MTEKQPKQDRTAPLDLRSALGFRLGPLEQRSEADLIRQRSEDVLVHAPALDAQQLEDVTPLPLGDLAALPVLIQLAQDDDLARSHVERAIVVGPQLPPHAPSQLGAIEGIVPGDEEVELVVGIQVDDVEGAFALERVLTIVAST